MSCTEMTGDLLELGLPAVGHGCNCKGDMGGGIAAQFRHAYPEMYAAYARRCARKEFVLGSFFRWDTPSLSIYNLATQPLPGRHADLGAIADSVRAALLDAESRGTEQLGLPRIGAGIGGLAWHDVRETLHALGDASPVELVVVTLPRRTT